MFGHASLQSPPEALALFIWSRNGGHFRDSSFESHYDREEEPKAVAYMGSRQDDTPRCHRGNTNLASRSASEGTNSVQPLCMLCIGGSGDEGERLFRCPCKCSGKMIHRACLELHLNQGPAGASCHSCGAEYRVRRVSKPAWLWFCDQDSRKQAALFVASLAFTAGNVAVLAMAWLYAMGQSRFWPWPQTVFVLMLLLVFSFFWVAFGFILFQARSEPLARWKNNATTVEPLLDDEGIE
ncbi:hypothetical protein HPB48_020231 [Haemaphysalis longicornis]|uniref:RING-CH-type domain-containing protein n=1 Tax=Haemaphysalis longicornis TaxID=44386 RepID=A0A9J6FDK5_HAELO|nr:hypothetical protein HPB48_020231 [Haemaphysalis longicornis]